MEYISLQTKPILLLNGKLYGERVAILYLKNWMP